MIRAGFRPCRRVTFVSAKVTKTILARARPQGVPGPSPRIKMARELAPLRQLSPRGGIRGDGPVAPNAWKGKS